MTEPGPLHAHLRRRTGRLHSRLDASAFLGALARSDVTLEHYARVLRAFAAVLAPLEDAVLGHEELGRRVPRLAARARAGAALADASYIEELLRNRTGPCAQGSTRDPRLNPPALALGLENAWRRPVGSLEEAFGRLYVMEGATLGGAYLASHLGPALALRPGEGGLTFFGGRGERTPTLWKEVLDALAQFDAGLPEGLEREARRDAVAFAACDTFALMAAFFDGCAFNGSDH